MSSDYVTKADLNQALEASENRMIKNVTTIVHDVVGEVVGEIMSDALTHIDNRFNKVEKRLDAIEKAHKITVKRVDQHTVLLDRLQATISP